MIRLLNTTFGHDGHTIAYHYEAQGKAARYFKKDEPFFVTYDRRVDQIPESIAVVPFLANIMPMAWFLGCEVEVQEVDETFYNALGELKTEFSKHFAGIQPGANLQASKRITNTIDGQEKALLFSGGLDSFESLTRNLQDKPYLVSVWGADVAFDETRRWADFQRFNHEEPIVDDSRLCYVKSNLRTFYTYETDLLVDVNWWGKIQHGMALIGLIAPLSHMLGIQTVLIASSNTGEVNFGWGSTSETDEMVRWANMNTIHDGFHLRRTEKIKNMVAFAQQTGEKAKLRVCYSEWREGYNCSVCTKCQRSMFGLILAGADPNDYGFEVPKDFYKLLFRNFNENTLMTTGVLYEWRCLQDLAKESQTPFVLQDAASEQNHITRFANLPLEHIVNKNAESQLKAKRAKYKLINRFPKLFQAYLKIRKKL